jgi:hypothetical protein
VLPTPAVLETPAAPALPANPFARATLGFASVPRAQPPTTKSTHAIHVARLLAFSLACAVVLGIKVMDTSPLRMIALRRVAATQPDTHARVRTLHGRAPGALMGADSPVDARGHRAGLRCVRGWTNAAACDRPSGSDPSSAYRPVRKQMLQRIP